VWHIYLYSEIMLHADLLRIDHAFQEEDRVVIIRFGHDWDQTCMQMDEVTFHMHV